MRLNCDPPISIMRLGKIAKLKKNYRYMTDTLWFHNICKHNILVRFGIHFFIYLVRVK